MCDYSLHQVRSRPAKVGDRLLTMSFSGTSTRGFAAVGELNVAVCLLPGTEVAFERPVRHGRFWPKNTGQRTAIVRELNKNVPGTYHDAVEFADGQTVLITRLRKGQRAVVLQLPSAATSDHERQTAEPDTVLAQYDRDCGDFRRRVMG
jgi:hypothetical protein